MEQLIVMLLFTGAIGYIGFRAWKAFGNRKKGGCAKGCGCE